MSSSVVFFTSRLALLGAWNIFQYPVVVQCNYVENYRPLFLSMPATITLTSTSNSNRFSLEAVGSVPGVCPGGVFCVARCSLGSPIVLLLIALDRGGNMLHAFRSYLAQPAAPYRGWVTVSWSTENPTPLALLLFRAHHTPIENTSLVLFVCMYVW